MKKLSDKAIVTNSLGTIVTALLGFGVIFFMLFVGQDSIVRGVDAPTTWTTLAAAVVLLGALGYAVLWVKLFRYEVADNEFKKEYGVISKSYTSIPYARIQNVNIKRSLLERMLGISTVEIQTAGNEMAGRAEGRIPGIDKHVAEEVREAILGKSRNRQSGESGV